MDEKTLREIVTALLNLQLLVNALAKKNDQEIFSLLAYTDLNLALDRLLDKTTGDR